MSYNFKNVEFFNNKTYLSVSNELYTMRDLEFSVAESSVKGTVYTVAAITEAAFMKIPRTQPFNLRDSKTRRSLESFISKYGSKPDKRTDAIGYHLIVEFDIDSSARMKRIGYVTQEIKRVNDLG